MTMKEAEQFFKQTNGNGYFMCLDSERKYEEFQSLNISADILQKWRQEKVDSLYADLWKDKNDTCFKLEEIFNLISYQTMNADEQMKVFISELSKCEILDNRFKIILIESIAGKTPSKKDGVLYFVSNYTNLRNELIEIVDKLLNFQIIEDKKLADRLSDAKKSYEKAFKNFSSKKGKQKQRMNKVLGFNFNVEN